MDKLTIGSVPLNMVNGYGRTEFSVEGTTADSLVDDQGMRFAPPVSPKGDRLVAQNAWRRLQFALDMKDPGEFPSKVELNSGERATLIRFRNVANDLGDSSVINGDWNFHATFRPGQVDEVRGELPSNLEMAGFASYLRQCDVQHEGASFNKVHKLLGKGLRSLSETEQEWGGAVLKSWRRARRQMKSQFVDQLVIERLAISGKTAPESIPNYPWTPEWLMKSFNYGELIHWGNRREELETVTSLPPGHRRYVEFRFFEAAQYFGHFYLGVAGLIDQALQPT